MTNYSCKENVSDDITYSVIAYVSLSTILFYTKCRSHDPPSFNLIFSVMYILYIRPLRPNN